MRRHEAQRSQVRRSAGRGGYGHGRCRDATARGTYVLEIRAFSEPRYAWTLGPPVGALAGGRTGTLVGVP